MKFRYAARVQQSLIAYENLLDISIELTRINCEIAEMQQVETRRGDVDREKINRMMQQQAFDATRVSRWRAWLEAPATRTE